ncbi:MAG: nucleotidyltransferase domain-containing protein [Bacteroidota bacterium]
MKIQESYIKNLIKDKIYKKNPNAEVILFGSHARGDANIDSDWDILILLNMLNVDRETEKEYREELFDIELNIEEPISTFVYSKKDWETKYAITPLFKSIKKEGILL